MFSWELRMEMFVYQPRRGTNVDVWKGLGDGVGGAECDGVGQLFPLSASVDAWEREVEGFESNSGAGRVIEELEIAVIWVGEEGVGDDRSEIFAGGLPFLEGLAIEVERLAFGTPVEVAAEENIGSGLPSAVAEQRSMVKVDDIVFEGE
jgi:hypothetical protein